MMSAMSRFSPSRRLRALLPLLAFAVAGACTGGNNVPVNSGGFGADTSYARVPALVVTLRYSSFEPAVGLVHAGQSVLWSWQDFGITHNVRVFSPTGAILAQSPTMGSGSWSYTFVDPGTYPYVSTVDAKMGGTVVVKP
jgi:plastocyanin